MPQAHIYSLGATLKAALEYVAEPEPRLSRDLEALLDQMQAEDPRDRPDLEVTRRQSPRLSPQAGPHALLAARCLGAACTRSLAHSAHTLGPPLPHPASPGLRPGTW